ncbi:MAG: energy-coupling factor transporter transmembrane protein EcfT [Treponema sp.]|nr:energy-coupling factor transporter transmembrane protein EcfT [Treponema sp.]
MPKLRLNPIVLIVINILAPSMYIFLDGGFLKIYLIAFATVLLLATGCYKIFLVTSLIYFSMEGCIILSRFVPAIEAFALYLVVLQQSVPCFGLVFALMKKYNSAELLSSLETMRIPRTLVVAVTISIKYCPTFAREFKYIRESMRLRGIPFSLRHPVKSFQYFIVPQLFRCAALSEEVTAAGLVKGIDAPMKRTSYFEQKFRFIDGLFLVLFIAGLIGGLIWYKK